MDIGLKHCSKWTEFRFFFAKLDEKTSLNFDFEFQMARGVKSKKQPADLGLMVKEKRHDIKKKQKLKFLSRFFLSSKNTLKLVMLWKNWRNKKKGEVPDILIQFRPFFQCRLKSPDSPRMLPRVSEMAKRAAPLRAP